MAGTGLAERLLGDAGRSRHLLLPLRPFRVVDHERYRGPEREPVPDTAGELDVVTFEPHPGAAPEAETAPSQLGRDLVDRDGQTGREPFDHDRQGWAVRLPAVR